MLKRSNSWQAIVIGTVAILSSGCAIPTKNQALIPPPGYTKAKMNGDLYQCLQAAQQQFSIAITREELERLGDIDTNRFFHGGSTPIVVSQRYVLCLLNKNYQLLEMPVNWLSISDCELLNKYQSAGIEKERLIDICREQEKSHCNACKSFN